MKRKEKIPPRSKKNHGSRRFRFHRKGKYYLESEKLNETIFPTSPKIMSMVVDDRPGEDGLPHVYDGQERAVHKHNTHEY